MLASHDYITTYLNGALRFDKPILIYWLQALSASIFGLNEFAVRLPSAVAATLWAWAIYRFGKRFFDEKTAFWATIFMVGSLQISIIAKAAIADALLNLFIALSMFCFYTYTHTRQKRYLYATFAAIAFGTLTKGPVAILIPLAVSFLYLVRDLRFWLRSVFDPVGIAIFLALAAPWYIAEYLAQGDLFIQGFFLKHNLGRFESAMEGHTGPIFYYVIVLLVGLIPFTSIFLFALRHIKEWFATPLRRYLALWFGFVFIFFSLSHTKLPHYIIYGYTPLFFFMALYFPKMRSRFWLLVPYFAFVLIALLLPILQPVILSSMHPGRYDYQIVAALRFGWEYWAFFIAALVLGVWMVRLPKERSILLASALTLLGLNLFLAKVYAQAAEEPIKEAALFAKEHNLSVVMDGINTPSFAFYEGRIAPKRNAKPGEVVLTKKEKLKKFKNFDILFAKNAIVLIRLKESR